MNKKLVVSFWVLFSHQFYGYNKFHITTLKDLIAKKQEVNASGCDFRGTESKGRFSLKGINFSGLQLSGSLFSMPTKKSTVGGIVSIPNQKSDLTGAKFFGSTCISADFSNTILKNADFSYADISYANFAGADLTGANFKNAQNVVTAVFCGATMPDGSKCNGSSWQNRSKTVTLYCNCPTQKS